MKSKLFTDLKLNSCITTASLLLLASFDASAQAQPPIQQQMTEQIASLKTDVKLLTEKNQRMIASAMNYGACLTALQNEALITHRSLSAGQYIVKKGAWIEYGLSTDAHTSMLSKSNNCQKQFTDSFK